MSLLLSRLGAPAADVTPTKATIVVDSRRLRPAGFVLVATTEIEAPVPPQPTIVVAQRTPPTGFFAIGRAPYGDPPAPPPDDPPAQKPLIVVGQAPRTLGVQIVQRGFLEESGRVASVIVTPRTRPQPGRILTSAGTDSPLATPAAAVINVAQRMPASGLVITGHGYVGEASGLADGFMFGARRPSSVVISAGRRAAVEVTGGPQ